MKNIRIVPANPLFLQNECPTRVTLDAADYEQRIALLLGAMKQRGLTHAVIYGDREHFANVEYFTGFEPRFEQTLFVITADDKRSILLGNECFGYSDIIPYPIERILYQNFSLQGQPRGQLKPLHEIFGGLGIDANAKVGLVGYKYFYPEYDADAENMYDIPMYIYQALCKATPNVSNLLPAITGVPDGIRMEIRTAKEIAYAEYHACKAANVVQRILKAIKPGITEAELSTCGGADFSPTSAFPMLNFGDHISIGLRSPGDRTLELGQAFGLCYAIRWALCARVGVAAYDLNSYPDDVKPLFDSFFKPFWRAIATWYESLRVGVSSGEVYDNVMGIIGDPSFGVTLNPGHYIGGDEWTNAPFAKGSTIPLSKPAHLQSDIICSSGDPIASGICEDGIVLADAALRDALAKEYPDVWQRIQNRRAAMRDTLGIHLHEDVLPLSNLCGAYFPFMLDTTKVFAFDA